MFGVKKRRLSRLRRVVPPTLSEEIQSMPTGFGHAELMALHVAELRFPDYFVADRSWRLWSIKLQVVLGSKSHYDRLISLGAPSGLDGTR